MISSLEVDGGDAQNNLLRHQNCVTRIVSQNIITKTRHETLRYKVILLLEDVRNLVLWKSLASQKWRHINCGIKLRHTNASCFRLWRMIVNCYVTLLRHKICVAWNVRQKVVLQIISSHNYGRCFRVTFKRLCNYNYRLFGKHNHSNLDHLCNNNNSCSNNISNDATISLTICLENPQPCDRTLNNERRVASTCSTTTTTKTKTKN